VRVPAGLPRTKPRALNAALPLARGACLVVYDAEDVPDPGQLRAAATRFAHAAPETACLQGRLVIDNLEDGRLTRCFAIGVVNTRQFLDASMLGYTYGMAHRDMIAAASHRMVWRENGSRMRTSEERRPVEIIPPSSPRLLERPCTVPAAHTRTVCPDGRG
jgi:hypothetical protein